MVKIPLCFVGWGRGELKENGIMLEVNQKVLLKWRIGMSQETPELFTGEQGGRAESSNIFFLFKKIFFLCVWWYGKGWVIPTTPVQCCYVVILFIYLFIYFFFFCGGDDRTPLKFCNFGCYCLYIFVVVVVCLIVILFSPRPSWDAWSLIVFVESCCPLLLKAMIVINSLVICVCNQTI